MADEKKFRLFSSSPSEVDSREFFVAAEDSKGHSVAQNFRHAPGMDRAIQEIMESKKFPYKTKSDLLRHATQRHIEWLNEKVKVVSPSIMVQMELTNNILFEAKVEERFNNLCANLHQTITSMISIGASSRIGLYLEKVRPQIMSMDPFWRNRFVSELKNRWGHVMEIDWKE